MMKPPSLTIGVEEEYQIIDPETRELKAYITEILEADHVVLRQVKPELHQSIVEVGTTICNTPAEVRSQLIELRRGLMELAARKGLKIAAAGTHPFSHWKDQPITQMDRYVGTREAMQQLAEQLLIFGTHVHIGIEDPDFLIDAMNVSRYVLPHILALSTSSPFWIGRNTGLKSYRSVIFRAFPRSGVPRTIASYGDYQKYLATLVETGCIPDGSKIWWDVRPHHTFPTLEFRICDVCTRVDEAVCIAAILQTLIFKLWKMRQDNTTFRIYSSDLIDENKWRAVRYGLDGQLIDFGKQRQMPARELIREFIEWFLGDAMDELGTRKDIEYAFQILEEGSSADRQLKVFNESGGNLHKVVDHLIRETELGVV